VHIKKEGFQVVESLFELIDGQIKITFIKHLFKAGGDRAGPDITERRMSKEKL
jgi:hypothetical protein